MCVEMTEIRYVWYRKHAHKFCMKLLCKMTTINTRTIEVVLKLNWNYLIYTENKLSAIMHKDGDGSKKCN
jgi:hypothetical protein